MPFLEAALGLAAENKAVFFALGPVVTAVVYALYQIFLSPLAKVPGPFWAKFSRLWFTKQSGNGRWHRTVIDLHDQYGPLVRVAPNELSVADLTAFKKIYGAGAKFEKADWYSVWQGRRKFDLFAGRHESIHGQQRRLVARAYSMDAMKDLEQYVDGAIKQFLRGMDQRIGETVDMGNWMQLFAFDVIGEITFSKPFGFMEAGVDDGSFSEIENAMRCGAWLGQVPWLFWLHDYLQPVIGNRLAITARNGSMRQFTVRETQARKDRGSDRKDILSKLFAVNKERPTDFEFPDVVSMVASNIFAGSDTTASSGRSIIYYLLKNPQYKKKLIDEIDEFGKQGKLSDPVRFDEAEKMPYLQAVMYEGIRCHPAVGLNLPRVVPPGGVEMAGTYVPAGTVVGVNAWAIHQNKDVFGEDAAVFRPDRWLKEDVGDMHRFFFSFGGGSRTCIGRNISWMELSKLISTLFMHYDVQLKDPEASWTEICAMIVKQTGFDVVLRPRK